MKILLETKNCPIAPNYFQTLVLLYLPCETFREDDDGSKTLIVRLSREEQTVSGEMLYTADGVTSRKAGEGTVDETRDEADTLKSFSGRLFLELFSERFGFVPPWGMLVGVRPARFALDFLINGRSEDELAVLLHTKYGVSDDKARLAASLAVLDQQVIEKEKPRSCSLYIGIPFCPTKCRYCSFVSYATPRLLSLLSAYVERLIGDTQEIISLMKQQKLALRTVYVGGGTPSVLDEALLSRLFEGLGCSIDFGSLEEFTFEAGRPDTITRDKLRILHEGGVSRLCVNTQTTNDDVLSHIGRHHTAADYFRAFSMAQEEGFTSINTDLIAGLPGDTAAGFEKSLRDVIGLAPENITVHAFSLKKSSDFRVSGETIDIAASEQTALDAVKYELLSSAGYTPYYMYRQKNTAGNLENTGFCRDGALGLYNVVMMEELHSVFAVGAGASTKLVSEDRRTVKKLYNPKYPYEYLAERTYMDRNKAFVSEFYNDYYPMKDSR